MLEITPISMNLSVEFRCLEVTYGQLNSEFERVNNYIFYISDEERMLTVMSESNTLLPDSIILKKEHYATLKRQTAKSAVITNNSLIIGQIIIHFIQNINCSLIGIAVNNYNKENFEKKRMVITDFFITSKKKTDFDRLPKRYNKNLNQLVDALINDDCSAMMLAFSRLVGAGKGLTPAADDAIIGVLSGYLLILSLENKIDIYLKKMKLLVSLLSNEKFTTKISLKYLRSACFGEFSQDLYMLIEVLLSNNKNNILPILQRIKETGHSSGMDMLFGLKTILEKI